jgi:hypothetical protein
MKKLMAESVGTNIPCLFFLSSKIFFPSQSFKSISFLSKQNEKKLFRLKKYTEEDFEIT